MWCWKFWAEKHSEIITLCSRCLPCACVQCFSFLSLDWLNVLVTCTLWMISCELNKDRCYSWSLSQTSLNILWNLLTDRIEVISYCRLVSYLLFSSNLLEPGLSLTFWWPSHNSKWCHNNYFKNRSIFFVNPINR
jgi:hypothetical protein